jgi:hypothetical protein
MPSRMNGKLSPAIIRCSFGRLEGARRGAIPASTPTKIPQIPKRSVGSKSHGRVDLDESLCVSLEQLSDHNTLDPRMALSTALLERYWCSVVPTIANDLEFSKPGRWGKCLFGPAGIRALIAESSGCGRRGARVDPGRDRPEFRIPILQVLDGRSLPIASQFQW